MYRAEYLIQLYQFAIPCRMGSVQVLHIIPYVAISKLNLVFYLFDIFRCDLFVEKIRIGTYFSVICKITILFNQLFI